MKHFTSHEDIKRKIITLSDAKKITGDIIFTNGCFDLIHTGHILNFQDAKRLGGTLVVGINSDASVTRIKRVPLQDELRRALTVAAFDCVDYVIVFTEDTPCTLIETLRPKFYVKGGDYTLDTLNQDVRKGAEAVGAEIVFIPYILDHSTTSLLEKMKKK